MDAADWKWWHPMVPTRLRDLFSQGFSLIVFTNQGRLTTTTGAEAPESQLFKAKVEAMGHDLGVPFTVYAACANDLYRKPRTGMWDVMCEDFGLRGVICGKEGQEPKEAEVKRQTLFVGDAAGRETDHSDSDRHFCENLGICFSPPEEFFLGDMTQALGHKFDPSWYLPSSLGGSAVFNPSKRIQILATTIFKHFDLFYSF
jgi:bifunctional polynucleotide phosphatase/kinase